MSTATGPRRQWRTHAQRLGVCAHAGLAVGIVTGVILMLLDLIDGPLEDDSIEMLGLWAMLGAFGWFVIVGLFTVFVRYELASVAMPGLVNAALTTGLMVAVCRATGLFEIAWLIGLLGGLLVGQTLCSLHRHLAAASKDGGA